MLPLLSHAFWRYLALIVVGCLMAGATVILAGLLMTGAAR